MPSAIRRIDVAGRDVTEHLQMLLRKAGAVFHTSAEKEVVRLIKEKTAYIAMDPKKEEKEWAGGANVKFEEYRLPDGNVLRVSLLWVGGMDFYQLARSGGLNSLMMGLMLCLGI